MTPQINFSEKDWEDLAQNWNAWWAGDLERPLVMIESPPRKREPQELTLEFLRDWPVERVLDYYQSRLGQTRWFGDAWPKWWPFFGAGVVAAFLGAELFCAPQDGTIWFEPSQPLVSYDLKNLYHPHNTWWLRILDLTQAAVERWRDTLCVGHTDLGGNLDILASLRTSQGLLLDLYDCPAEVDSACGQITQFWLQYQRQLHSIAAGTGRGCSPWAPIWAPSSCYMLQSDFSAMISPKMFERFILPDLDACCQELDYPFYHMDGKGQIPHLDLLLEIDNLKGIQWIPGDGQPPPEKWLPLLKQIRDGGKLCQLFVSADGALEIVRHLTGNGFAFYILDDLTSDEAQNFLRKINTA